MSSPRGEVDPRAAAAAMAVLRGSRTVRQVGAACGGIAPSTAGLWLALAKEAGLVDYEAGASGTLRPAVEVVAHNPDWRTE